MIFFFLFLFSSIFCLVTVMLLRVFSLKYNFLVKGTPLVGGLAVAAAFFITSLFGSQFLKVQPQVMLGIFLSSLIMLGFGIIDDLREVSIITKLLMQVIACAILAFFGIKTHIVYIGNMANLFITFVWILGITNAFNHLDVMDGVAVGTGAIVSLGFLWIAFLTGNTTTMLLALALTGSLLGFFIINFPPAKVYLGNAGSHFLGFILAAGAMVISYAPLQRKIALLSPILMLGFPIFDTLFLIIMRLKQGRVIFKKSNDHFVLRLLRVYVSKRKSLFVTLVMALFFVLCAVATSQATNLSGAGIIILAIFISIYAYLRMSRVRVDG